jgi:hypothetical protein
VDDARFDALARSLDVGSSRRALAGLAGGLLATMAPTASGRNRAAAKKKKKKCKKRGKRPCRPAKPPSPRVTFDIRDGVSAEDEAYIREGIRLTQDFVAATFGLTLTAPITILVQTTAPQGSSPADAGGRRITVRTTHEVWVTAGALQRTKIAVHEFIHLLQEDLRDGAGPGPIWLLEGTAEYLAYLAVAEKGLIAFDAVRDYFFGGAALSSELDLAEMESVQGLNTAAQGCCAYSLTPLAAELLTAGPGVGAIAEYYKRLGRREGAAAAFAAVFGVPLDDFYETFADARQGFAQQDPTHPSLWTPIEFEDGAAVVAIAEVTNPLARGEQGVLQAVTDALVECTLEVTSSQDQILVDTPTHADPAGTLFWLFTIGQSAAIGTATAEVRCGADPDTIMFEVG